MKENDWSRTEIPIGVSKMDFLFISHWCYLKTGVHFPFDVIYKKARSVVKILNSRYHHPTSLRNMSKYTASTI